MITPRAPFTNPRSLSMFLRSMTCTVATEELHCKTAARHARAQANYGLGCVRHGTQCKTKQARCGKYEPVHPSSTPAYREPGSLFVRWRGVVLPPHQSRSTCRGPDSGNAKSQTVSTQTSWGNQGQARALICQCPATCTKVRATGARAVVCALTHSSDTPAHPASSVLLTRSMSLLSGNILVGWMVWRCNSCNAIYKQTKR